MIYLRKLVVHHYEPMCDWGGASSYLEIGDDLYATRQVDIYENGNALRYDRNNWADDCGLIRDARYDAEQWLKWWGPDEKITASEFEAAWALAEKAPNQPQTYNPDAGPWPMLIAEKKREQLKSRRRST